MGFAVTVLQAGHQIFSQGDCSEVCGSPKAHKANCDPYPKGSRFTKRSHRWSLNPATSKREPGISTRGGRAQAAREGLATYCFSGSAAEKSYKLYSAAPRATILNDVPTFSVGDAFRLCGAYIPDVDRITACLRGNGPRLSRPCYDVFFPPQDVNTRRRFQGRPYPPDYDDD